MHPLEILASQSIRFKIKIKINQILTTAFSFKLYTTRIMPIVYIHYKGTKLLFCIWQICYINTHILIASRLQHAGLSQNCIHSACLTALIQYANISTCCRGGYIFSRNYGLLTFLFRVLVMILLYKIWLI